MISDRQKGLTDAVEKAVRDAVAPFVSEVTDVFVTVRMRTTVGDITLDLREEASDE